MSSRPNPPAPPHDADAALLARMGYEQELHRRMGGFTNFAVSFSIICILAGGITAFPTALGAGGGMTVSLGWIVGAAFATVVALSMAQIASAFPTAGGLYHWSSQLGSTGYGWVTAWFNLIGLLLVLPSVNVGLFDVFVKPEIAPMLGLDPSGWGLAHQSAFVALATVSQAWLNHRALGLATRLLDVAGWLIFAVTVVLVASLWLFSTTPLELSRLWTFVNLSGTEGSIWPQMESAAMVFLAGLLLTVYTITGFDASAHAAEETRDAATAVPRGIVSAVLWSALFGLVMVSTFVLVLPDLAEGVRQGPGFLPGLLGALPRPLHAGLVVALAVVNYLCALACLMSTSRMVYAFARDGGLPMSSALRRVDPRTQAPAAAIWTAAAASFAVTLYADAFSVLVAGCAVFLYVSYVMPIAAGLWAEGRSWTRKGPFDLGVWSRPVAALAVLGGATLIFVGVQPPNEKVRVLVLGLLAVLAVLWWGLGERRRFAGPPRAEAG